MTSPKLNIVIGIATAGRREVLTDTISSLNNQTRMANTLLVCPAQLDDIDEDALRLYRGPSQVLYGPRGLPAQRNTIMAATDADLIIFFDDDFLPAPDFLAETEALFEKDPSIVIATGEVAADGICGPGLSHNEALNIIQNLPPQTADHILSDTYNGYGCNMVIRMAPVRQNGQCFDENLPLYAWLEDVDFSRQLAPAGRIVKSSRLRGVHMGTKRSGRTPGRKLGYSQIANPLYMMRKGTLRPTIGYKHMAKNIAANLARSLKPEPWVDRKGRLSGNLLAIKDWIRGTIRPDNILKL
ncbi:glycosyltransferase family 2 protein [Asticcacaulis tiandongensis]|uniref:glycosyltransferase family 2 protein n=1 Tax=Asticcacaulis tiandongensis TaxID=2565365 RepID=UPI0011296277|nr:glycosyltransferase family 2 protein [Asticcacaulis tiandongensis]